VDLGPRTAHWRGVLGRKLLEAIKACSGLGGSTFGEVESQPLYQCGGDQPSPSARTAQILRLLQKRVGMLDVLAAGSDPRQYDVGP
jgi:hypothetical protein